jgi:hypothetical protein
MQTENWPTSFTGPHASPSRRACAMSTSSCVSSYDYEAMRHLETTSAILILDRGRIIAHGDLGAALRARVCMPVSTSAEFRSSIQPSPTASPLCFFLTRARPGEGQRRWHIVDVDLT